MMGMVGPAAPMPKGATPLTATDAPDAAGFGALLAETPPADAATGASRSTEAPAPCTEVNDNLPAEVGATPADLAILSEAAAFALPLVPVTPPAPTRASAQAVVAAESDGTETEPATVSAVPAEALPVAIPSPAITQATPGPDARPPATMFQSAPVHALPSGPTDGAMSPFSRPEPFDTPPPSPSAAPAAQPEQPARLATAQAVAPAVSSFPVAPADKTPASAPAPVQAVPHSVPPIEVATEPQAIPADATRMAKAVSATVETRAAIQPAPRQTTEAKATAMPVTPPPKHGQAPQAAQATPPDDAHSTPYHDDTPQATANDSSTSPQPQAKPTDPAPLAEARPDLLPSAATRGAAQPAEPRFEPAMPRSPLVQAAVERIAPLPAIPGETVLRLNPHGLGLIEVTIQQGQNGTLDVALRVQNPLVLHAMRQEWDAVAQAITPPQGTQTGSLTMDLFQSGTGAGGTGTGQRDAPPAPRPDRHDGADDETPPPQARPDAAPVLRAGHVNIVT